MLVPLLLLGVGAIAYLSGRRAAREVNVARSHKTIPSGVPSPLIVLDGFLRAGRQPPPEVVLCSIAEAELMGRIDVANELVRAFVLPVVAAAERDAAASARDANHDWAPERGDRSPDARRPIAREIDPGADWAPQPPDLQPPLPQGSGGGRGAPRPIARAEDVRVEIVPAAAGQGVNAGTITVSGRSSPIEGIGAEEWTEFVTRVAREQPTFMTAHHVGRFRQRRDRLADLGIDPAKIVNSPDAQAEALDADMRDAYGHADESGLIAEYRGVVVEIPSSGASAPIEITLSGVLGVIQAAGLEGAAGWLEHPGDRVRFPHTTAAFLRTNGVF